MNGPVSDTARALAVRLDHQFGRDAELTKRLACAQDRLMRANDAVVGVFTLTDSPPSTRGSCRC